MKKSNSVVIAVVVVLIVVGGSFVIFHKSPKASPTHTSANSINTPVNDGVLSTKTDAALGHYLANPSGMPLYTYGSDTSGASNCTGSCLSNWPAYQDTGSTTDLPTGVSTITRTDNGQIQYTYNGMPLYIFVGDSNGKVTGNGVSNFNVATPAATSSPQSTASPTTPTQSSNPYNY